MSFKFEKLEIWQLSLDYINLIYEIAAALPREEEFNLKSQIRRAATSIALNIAEGSTGQTDAEQVRFLGMALRSLIETVACQHLIHRRAYLPDSQHLREAYQQSQALARKIQAMRRAISPERTWVREENADYLVDDGLQTMDDRP
jgi:four helix bundle protein